MNKDIAIKVENLSKVYKLYNAPIDRMKEALHPRKKSYHKEFYALNDVSFEIKRGECVGILGKNGAGKSTILKIITGVLTPTSGQVTVNGKISALLELGAGFNPEYTGMENIYFQGNLMGFDREEMDAKVQKILDFADIGAFIDQPVKNYSSGMFARLAFAVAISVEPDILIVDEALSVGDMFFQAKSMSHMKRLIENDKTTVLFVSHDIASIKAMCSKAVLLENGYVKMFDRADKVAEEYFALRFDSKSDSAQQQKRIMAKKANIALDSRKNLSEKYSNEVFKTISSFQRIQNGKACYTNVVLLDEDEKPIESVEFGKTVTLRCFIEANEDVHALSCGFHVRNRTGVDILYDSFTLQKREYLRARVGSTYILDWKFKILLQASQYTITAVMSIPINVALGEVDMCDFIPIAAQFSVETPTANVYAAMYANSTLQVNELL
jgi:lipopolysaccharide transport system ATP-binding protein